MIYAHNQDAAVWYQWYSRRNFRHTNKHGVPSLRLYRRLLVVL